MPKPIPLASFPDNHPVMHTPCVWHAQAPRDGYTVLLMRRRFVLPAPARGVRLWVSASQRFILHLDGAIIARGPARSDPGRWGVSQLSVGDLSAGPHVLAAIVYHLGNSAGIGQLGGPGFFLLHGEARGHDLAPLVDTADAWRCVRDESRSPLPTHAWGDRSPYFVVGAGERIDASKILWNWEQPDFDDSDWPPAKVVCRKAQDDWGNIPAGHILRPDPIPPMQERPEQFTRIAEASEGYRPAAERLISGDGDLAIPPHAEVRLVVDRGELTNAYPILTVSGGAGSRIQMVSAEAGYDENRNKTERDITAGKHLYGFRDELLPDGGDGRALTTLWFRSFRYIELCIATADQPLTLHSLIPAYSAYPLRERARFAAGGEGAASYRKIWDVSWRTARLCAHETFFDCPHYEQAQFPGDTRVQAIYHYLVSNDDRLARKAIDDFHASRLEEGLTQCRYPSRVIQVIPTFSLYWIGMLHDLWLYRGDAQFVSRYMPFAREVLAWYQRRLRNDGLLGRLGYAPFMDWTKPFACGNAPQDADGGSSILTLLLATACRWMVDLEKSSGFPELSRRWGQLADSLNHATLHRCWDARRKFLADTAAKKTFSQHAQVQAVLAGIWRPTQAREVLARAISDPSITAPGTFYYRYYVAQALRATRLGAGFFDLLKRWESVLGTGLATWPESDVNPRSDCHAWSVTPAIEFLQTVLGITPHSPYPGFERAIFRPELGPLDRAEGVVPTPRGNIRVKLRRDGKRIEARLTTPIPLYVPRLRLTLSKGNHEVGWAAPPHMKGNHGKDRDRI